MPQYALLIYSTPGPITEEEGMAEMPRWFEYTSDLEKSGLDRGGEALQPMDTATTVRVRDGETLITDGPFAETKETLGGFYLLDAPDLDTALSWAATHPERRPRCRRGAPRHRLLRDVTARGGRRRPRVPRGGARRPGHPDPPPR